MPFTRPNPVFRRGVYSPVTGTVATTLTLPLDAGGTPGTDADAGYAETPEVRRCLARARRGDKEAFGRLVELHQRLVFRTALVALGTREDAEDTAQDAFLVAWRKLAGFRGHSSFRTWLLTIAWRKALDRRRARLLRWKRTAPAPLEGDLVEGLPAAAPSPESHVLGRDEIRRAQRAIAALSPTLRDTLLLAASGEHTYEEIAALLGAPLGTIKWRVSEARRQVAGRLDR